MIRIGLTALLYLFSSVGLSMTVEDPTNQALHLRQLFPPITEKPFTCEKPVSFSQGVSRCDILCELNHCRTQCQESMVRFFDMQAEKCDQPAINIVSGLSWNLTVPSQAAGDFGQTWIREFLESTDFFIVPSGVYELVFVMPPAKRIFVNEYGEEQEIQTVSIYLDYKQSPESKPIAMTLILDLNERGLDQILYFGFDTDKDYFLKKKGLL